MTVKTESIQQTATGTWAASGSVTVLLDRIGLVTRYEIEHQLTPSATYLAANQPDGLMRSFGNVSVIAGGLTYFTLPSDGGGMGGVLMSYLNRLDGFGTGHTTGGITAPDLTYVPIRLVFHAGVRAKRPGGLDNPFDLTGFVPAGIESSPQVTWDTTANSVTDDTVTISSGTLAITAHRVLGSTQDILDEMGAQGVGDLIQLVRMGAEGVLPNPSLTGFVPAWTGQRQSPTATWDNYGLELDLVLGGWIKRVSFLAQDATGTRALSAQDELTQLRLTIPERNVTILQGNSARLTLAQGLATQLTADDAITVYISGAKKGIYPVDLRPYGPTTAERVLGYDTRGRQTGYGKWGQTIGTNAAGDDIFVLTERLLPYTGRLSNS